MACMAVALILSALSCKKEKLPATAIYAPNGSVLGASMDDLASRIATVTELESQTLKIASIAFQPSRRCPPEGICSRGSPKSSRENTG